MCLLIIITNTHTKASDLNLISLQFHKATSLGPRRNSFLFSGPTPPHQQGKLPHADHSEELHYFETRHVFVIHMVRVRQSVSLAKEKDKTE